ncbi:MAG TPA: HAD-IC family P-type ATPase, partial [Candidatus Dormibacteraeota bacterium]|nr:HAD-IC family P-type ATPase [Candidatus Dormibacteraeota bacterium]
VVPADGSPSVVLGAPEALLPEAADPKLIAAVGRWADGGLRVLVLATSSSGLRDAQGEPALPRDIEPVALFGFAEQIRPDATTTLRAFEAAGVTIKVVSGDGPRTVAHIAEEAGLAGAEQAAANGPDLLALDDDALAARVEHSRVVGRVEPALKARIVGVLRARGRYVGMVGDGVNDILALKGAELGVAMETGSSASRAVADIVLLGDRFAVLPTAVSEGRRIIDAMVASSSLLLTRTLYILLVVLGAALAGLAFPFTPRNNSLLALITVGLPSLVVMAWARPVSSPTDFVRTVLRFAVPAAVAVASVAFPVYAWYLAHAASVDIARSALVTISTFCGTLLIPILAPSSTPDDPAVGRRKGTDARPLVLAAAMLVLFGAIMALPTARWFYEIEPLPLTDVATLWAIALVWAGAIFTIRRLGILERLEAVASGLRTPQEGSKHVPAR